MPEPLDEVDRDERYPLSRWCLRPCAIWIARRLLPTPVRPWHVSLVGAALACGAALWLAGAGPSSVCAALVLGAWFCDRVDGVLARGRGSASPRGAWLDGNLDELADVAWHVAAGAWLAQSSPWGWPLAIAFLSGKYLFVYGLHAEAESAQGQTAARPCRSARRPLASALYHLPANADVRLHAFALALATGWLAPELIVFAAYYHGRWIARYALVLRRLPGAQLARAAPPAPYAADAARLRDVSVTLIVRDEERHLGELLPHLAWAGEVVVVVDQRTTDASAAVAEAHGCRVFGRRFDHFAAQRNYALDQANCGWVLSIDADERPTPEMLVEMGRRLGAGAAAFRVPIRSRILRRPFRFSGTQDDKPLRLWRRGTGRWRGDVHERLVVEGPVETLAAGLHHDTLPTRAALRTKIERYTDLAAAENGAGRRATSPAFAALREFARRFVWKQGFRDGPPGLEFCLWSAYSEWVLARKRAQQRRAARPLRGVRLGSEA